MTGPSEAGVPRETAERLAPVVALLRKWTPRINLIAPETVPDVWSRHVADSLQLLGPIGDPGPRLADLGSGGGFPGLVLAVALDTDLHLVEADRRKATFLREAARRLPRPPTVHAARAETLDPLDASLVTARALAPLPRLLPLVARHLSQNGRAILPKGAGFRKEVEAARESWHFELRVHPSSTHPHSAILELRDLRRA